jgi:SAM-dependent methyltransferase
LGPARPELDAPRAYDLWASSYDNEPNNVLLVIDDDIFGVLLRHGSLKHKIVVDVGCGTGRHWKMLLAGEPAQLIGYDASTAMLDRLRDKHPDASVRLTTDHRLPAMADKMTNDLMDSAIHQMWTRVVIHGTNSVTKNVMSLLKGQ